MSHTIDRSPLPVRGEISAKGSLWRVRKILLACGIASSLLYGAAIWVIRYDGYNPISQTVRNCQRGAFPPGRCGWCSARCTTR
jgi:hypothetical protein